MEFQTFLPKREPATGFEEERERMVIGQSGRTSPHEIVKKDGLFWAGAMRVCFEHEIPSEDIGVLHVKEKCSRDLQIMMLGARERGK